MTTLGAMIVSALAVATLSLALLRLFPQLMGRLMGEMAKAVSLVLGTLSVCLIWFGIWDAHGDLCAAGSIDAKFRCETSFSLLIVCSLSFLVVILSQIPFAASVFAPLRLRHKARSRCPS